MCLSYKANGRTYLKYRCWAKVRGNDSITSCTLISLHCTSVVHTSRPRYLLPWLACPSTAVSANNTYQLPFIKLMLSFSLISFKARAHVHACTNHCDGIFESFRDVWVIHLACGNGLLAFHLACCNELQTKQDTHDVNYSTVEEIG